jgi:hypothetical protein
MGQMAVAEAVPLVQIAAPGVVAVRAEQALNSPHQLVVAVEVVEVVQDQSPLAQEVQVDLTGEVVEVVPHTQPAQIQVPAGQVDQA